MIASSQPAGLGSQLARRRRAFTLLELLVAVSITAVLAGFIVVVVSNVGTLWTRTSNRLSADAQARYILDQLALDLSSAQFRDDGNVWFAANVLDTTTNSSLWQPAATSTNVKPSGANSLQMATATLTAVNLTDARFGQAGVWLRFFTTKRGANAVTGTTTDLTTVSAPVAVGYQIIRRFTAVTATNQSTGYLFHRAEARAAATTAGAAARPGVLESGYNITGTAYQGATGGGTNSGATTGDPRSLKVPGAARTFDTVIGSNVIDFGVRCYVRDANQTSGLRLVFPATNETGTPSNVATASLASSLPPGTTVTATNYNQVFPDVVDVMVRILTDDGARLIAQFEANPPTPPSNSLPPGVTAQQYWWQLALAHSQVFTRRVVLNAQSI